MTKASELQVGDKFYIPDLGPRILVFEILEMYEDTETFYCQLDMDGLPQIQREFEYDLEVSRVFDA